MAMTNGQVKHLRDIVRTTVHRLNDVGMDYSVLVEGGEHYFTGLLAAANTVLTRLDAELDREIEERAK